MVKYQQLIDNNQFKTGDLLLFSHKDNCSTPCNCLFTCFTDLIKCCTNSKYSHSAIIIEGNDLKKLGIFLDQPTINIERYYVLQSSYEPFPDAENNQYKLGVEIVSLTKLFTTYEGRIFWRSITCKRDKDFYIKLAEAHSVVHNRPYDTNIIDWIKAAFKIEIGSTHKLNEFWCSALVAYVYTKLGFFDEKTNWTLVSPVMLSQRSNFPKYKNCFISQELQVL